MITIIRKQQQLNKGNLIKQQDVATASQQLLWGSRWSRKVIITCSALNLNIKRIKLSFKNVFMWKIIPLLTVTLYSHFVIKCKTDIYKHWLHPILLNVNFLLNRHLISLCSQQTLQSLVMFYLASLNLPKFATVNTTIAKHWNKYRCIYKYSCDNHGK